MASRKIEVEIIGDASSLERAFGRGQKSASNFQKGLGTATKVAGVALGALGLAAKVGFSELERATSVAAQTNQVLKTTGGVANVTANDVQALGSAIEHKSGIDDEAVKSAENLLLSFTKVRNEAGKGNDVFNRATQAVIDYSVRTGRDASSAALQFGKALEDPANKVAALARAGIVFTAQQKEQIKTLAESGDQLGAQKLILSALEERYGGAAEAAGKTFGGQLNIAKEEAKDFAATLVSGAIPTLTAFGRGLQAATSFLSQHQTATKAAIAVVGALSVGVLAVRAAMAVASAATAVWTAAQWLLNAALTANPVGLVIVAVAALAAGIVVAYNRSETFREIVNGAFNAVKEAVRSAISAILTVMDKFLGGFQAVAEAASHLPFVGNKFRGVADAIGSAREAVRGLRDDINGLPDVKVTTIRTVFETVGSAATAISGGIAFGGHRQHGGPVAAGKTYMVGETGPELVTFGQSGVVAPAPQVVGAGGTGGNTYITVNMPNYLGNLQDAAAAFRQELLRIGARNVTLGMA